MAQQMSRNQLTSQQSASPRQLQQRNCSKKKSSRRTHVPGGTGGRERGWNMFVTHELHCTCVPVSHMEVSDLTDLCGWEGCPVAGDSRHHHRTVPGAGTGEGLSKRQSSSLHNKHSSSHCTFSKSDSKLSVQSCPTAHESPDIPFDLTKLQFSDCEDKDLSTAHIEHYLCSYTYPNMEKMLAQSQHRGAMLCPSCAAAAVPQSRKPLLGHVTPKLVVLGEAGSQSHHSYHYCTPSNARPQGPTKPNPSLTPNRHSTTPHTITVHTTYPSDTTNRQFPSGDSTGQKLPTPCDRKWGRLSNPSTCSSGDSKHVYHMGVQWVSRSFPSFVVCSANSKATKKTPNRSSRPSSSSSSSPLGKATQSLTNKQTLKLSRNKSKKCSKAPSPFSVLGQPQAQRYKSVSRSMPQIRSQSHGLATRADLSHLLRHQMQVSLQNSRPGFRYETLCLEGRGAHEGMVPTDPTDRALSASPTHVVGPWIK